MIMLLAIMIFSAASAQTPLLIGAAAGLTNVMRELKTEFEKNNPKIKLKMTFAASGVINAQVRAGAPIDVFVSANSSFGGDRDYTKILDKKSIRIICTNSLAFAVGENTGINAKKSLISLLSASGMKRIGIGNPSYVPVGTYAKKLLDSKKIWNKVKSKMIMGNSVRQVLAWLEQGVVDGGFIYATDVAISGKLKLIKKYTLIDGQKLIYPVAVTKRCRNKALATKFIDYLISDKAKKIFRKYGFITK